MAKAPLKKTKKTDELKRTKQINVRLTEKEYQKLSAKADEYGIPMSSFLRDYILQAPKPIQRVHDLPKINPDLMRALTSIGNNLNQITRLANSQQASYGKIDIQTLTKSLDRIGIELFELQRIYTVKK